MATVRERLRLTTDEQTAAQAKDVLQVLSGPEGNLAVHRSGAEDRELPPELGRVIQRVIDVMARGGTVTITSTPKEVTTTTAAGMLGVSRPTVMGMIREGVLPVRKVGTHHRIATADVQAVLEARRARERAAFEELLDLED